MLGHHFCESILNPDLVIVGNLTFLKQLEAPYRLDEIAAPLILLLLGEVGFRPLQVIHVVDKHFKLDIDTDEELFAILRCSYELCKDKDGLISKLL